jgi:DNA-directed RNA polymerase specialized sigma24 family protein
MESQEILDAFLLWLGRDQASGADKYEEVRKKLILLFRCRSCTNPEELADETIDRTARAVLKQDFSYVGDPIAYFRGVARNVYLESQRKQRIFRPEPIAEERPELKGQEVEMPDEEIRSDCLERCLSTLPPGKKVLLLRYYQNDKRAKIDDRQLLAEEHGIGINTLRIQVFRLRNAVRVCVERCLNTDEMKMRKWPS